jgi:tetratricopeptide (TPR) repeat protein
LLKSLEILSIAVGQCAADDKEQTLRRAIAVGKRGLQISEVDPADSGLLVALRRNAYIYLALNYEELGEMDRARQACLAALQIDPYDLDATLLLDWLTNQNVTTRTREGVHDRYRHGLPLEMSRLTPDVPLMASNT